MKRLTILTSLLMLWAVATLDAAEKPLTLDVWPGQAPGEKGDVGDEKVLPLKEGQAPDEHLTNVTHPTITLYRPDEKTTRTAVLICPGGGYHILSMDKEGREVAAWLGSIGVTGVVLKYRVPRRKDQPKHLAPLQDAQRAMRLVRSHAAEWNIDPGRIGILGFSAGGHLSAATSTNFDKPAYEPMDETDQVSCRPDFAVLVYPAYLIEGNAMATEVPVGEKTPPTFFVHADDDHLSSANSVQMYLALKQAGVPAELHVFTTGGHGFGLRPSEHPCCRWPRLCEQWLGSRGLLQSE